MDTSMRKAQAKCRSLRDRARRFRSNGAIQAAEVLEKEARKLEATFRDHPEYESDEAFFLRAQGGR